MSFVRDAVGPLVSRSSSEDSTTDIEIFLRPNDFILLPVSKISGHLDVALRTYPMSLTEQNPVFFSRRTYFSLYSFPFDQPPPHVKRTGTLSSTSGGAGLLGLRATHHTRRYWLPSPLKHEHFALHFFCRASIVREGGADARLARARSCHPRLHALPWSPPRRRGPLGRRLHSPECGGWSAVLDRRRTLVSMRCARPIARVVPRVRVGQDGS